MYVYNVEECCIQRHEPRMIMGRCRPKTAMALNEMISNEGGANNRCDGSPIYIWLPKHTCSPAACRTIAER